MNAAGYSRPLMSKHLILGISSAPHSVSAPLSLVNNCAAGIKWPLSMNNASFHALRVILCFCLVALFGLAHLYGDAQAQLVPSDTSINITTVAPLGWWASGSKVSDYVVGVDREQLRNGQPCAYVKSIESIIEGSAGIMQKCSAENFVGKKLQFSAWMKTDGAKDGGAHLWFRVDGKEKGVALRFDNMDDRPVKGTTDWHSYSITLDVPSDAVALAYGFYVSGVGEAWVNDVRFVDIGRGQPIIPIPSFDANSLPRGPVNFNFAPSVHVWLVQIPRDAGASDADLREKADEFIQRFNQNSDFGIFAKQYGQENKLVTLTDLGWANPGDLKEEFRGPIMNSKVKSFVGPIMLPVNGGCMLFYVDSKK
ncbi:MAG: peptidylprolyl isomerase [Opitutaceae bacterium]